MNRKYGRCSSADEAVAALMEAAVEAQAKQAEQIAKLQAQLDAARFLIDLKTAELEFYHYEDAAKAAYQAQLKAAALNPLTMDWALANTIGLTIDGIPIKLIVDTVGRKTTRTTFHDASGAAVSADEKTTASADVVLEIGLLGKIKGRCKITSAAFHSGADTQVINRLEFDIPVCEGENRRVTVCAVAWISYDADKVNVTAAYDPYAMVDGREMSLSDLAVE